MELFRVGGDVPDTNYLFMGTARLLPKPCYRARESDCQAYHVYLQVTLLTEASILWNLSSFSSA